MTSASDVGPIARILDVVDAARDIFGAHELLLILPECRGKLSIPAAANYKPPVYRPQQTNKPISQKAGDNHG